MRDAGMMEFVGEVAGDDRVGCGVSAGVGENEGLGTEGIAGLLAEGAGGRVRP